MILSRLDEMMTRCKDRHVLLAAVALSSVIKGVLLFNCEVVNDDAVRYVNSAYQLMQGDFAAAFAHEKMLLYSLLLGLVHLLTDNWISAGLLISWLFLTLTLFPLYFLARELFGAQAALWTVAVFGLLPSINALTCEVVKDAPFLFFMTTALMVWSRGGAGSRFSSHWMFLASAACAALFRFEGVLLLGVYLMWLLYHAIFRPAARAYAGRGLLLCLAIAATCLGAVWGLLLCGLMDPAALKSVYLRFSQHYGKSDLLDNYRAIYAQLISVEHNFAGGQWSNDFFEIARHLMPVIYLLGLLQVVGAALSPAYVVPLFFGLWVVRSSSRDAGPLLWTALAYLFMGWFFITTRNFLSERYVLVVVVLVLPIVGHGFECLRSRLIALKQRQLVVAFALVVFVVFPGYQTFAGIGSEKIELRLAGEWLKSNRNMAATRMATTDERVPFYAGLLRGQYETFPGGTGGKLDEFAAERNCSMLVVDLSLRDMVELPAYRDYALVKEFPGTKRAVLIYEKIR